MTLKLTNGKTITFDLDKIKLNNNNDLLSFQKVKKGTPLAIKNKKMLLAEKNTILFMPLYQKQGADAFFRISNTPKWALNFSALLRKIKFDVILTLLPGISWGNQKKESLMVNLTIARFFTKSFFGVPANYSFR